MTLATKTLEVIGLRRKDDVTVNVELGTMQNGGPGALGPMPFGSDMIEVAEVDAPALGTLLTVSYALQA